MLPYGSAILFLYSMEKINLTATKRDVTGKAVNKSRKSGMLPGVLYGHNVEATPLQIKEQEFSKAFKRAGESTLIDLNVDGTLRPVLVHEVQYHYLTSKPIHVDFYAVNMTEKLTAHIPLHFTGESQAIKALGGVLVKNLSEVEVECLPGDLPPYFEIDISKLNTFEDVIRVADIAVSDKVEIKTNPDEVVTLVAAPRTEEELKSLEEKPVEADVTQVEGVVKPEAEEATDEAKETAKKEKE